jgi:hypothetical protein
MNRLLRKFRIDAELVLIDDDKQGPSAESIDKFESLSQQEIGEAGSTSDKSAFYVRLSEHMKEHSSDASLVIVSLPFPRSGMPTRKFMAYLEMLTSDLPPTILIRGNQQSVLTFYS